MQRHFAVFRLPAPSHESLFTIVTSILEVSTIRFALVVNCIKSAVKQNESYSKLMWTLN